MNMRATLRVRIAPWYIRCMAGQCYRLRACALALPLLLVGCVVVPRTVESYDAHCRMVARRMTLDAMQVATLGGCNNEGCAVLLAAAGVTAAASAIVSGSIAVIGNAVYWLERQGRCDPQDPRG
jgi:hypothetical protein